VVGASIRGLAKAAPPRIWLLAFVVLSSAVVGVSGLILRDGDQLSDPVVLRGHKHPVHAVTISPDFTTLATAGGSTEVAELRLWDAATGSVLANISDRMGPIRYLAFSPSGKVRATAGDDRSVRLHDTKTGKQQAVLLGHTEPVRRLAFSPNGQTLASLSLDRTVRLWNVAKAEVQTVYHLPLAWSRPTGTTAKRDWRNVVATCGLASLQSIPGALSGGFARKSTARFLSNLWPSFERKYALGTGERGEKFFRKYVSAMNEFCASRKT
jgi:hypothetical protein